MRYKSGDHGGLFHLKKPVAYNGPNQVDRSTSVIIPFGSLDYLKPLSKCLLSVRWQEHVKPRNVEIVLVYLHRFPEDDRVEEMRQMDELVCRFGVRLLDVQRPYDHFPLCLARNIGARAASNDPLVFIDADAILDPEFLARSLLYAKILVTCWFSYLNEGHEDVTSKDMVRPLARKGDVRKAAYGGGIMAPKTVINAIRGFDEVYDRAWGGDDNDIVDRLLECGLGWHNLSLRENIVNLHQYHPQKVNVEETGVVANRKRYQKLKTLVRNNNDWGRP